MVKIVAKWHQSIKEIPNSHWEDLLHRNLIPFYNYKWLLALEESGSISHSHGWQPLHLALWRGNQPIAFAPLYLKAHSWGEFVFDQSFAQLAENLGLHYYPKLIGMSPFSPVEGYRFFISPGEDEVNLTALMIRAIDQFAIKHHILSCNFLYVDQVWQSLATANGCHTWINKHSIGHLNGKKNFNDYLASFNSNQRRNIKKERKSLKDLGITVSTVNGSEINQNLMEKMYFLYESHCNRWGPWGSKYLEEGFFRKLSSPKLRNQLVLFSAHRGNPQTPLAMSLCVASKEMLWGRYWGSQEEIDCLHFEVCYYSPIAWAIENGIKSFDPGAGGSHKRRRGFLAKPHISLHRWYNTQMNGLIREWLPKANELMLREIDAENNDVPFRTKPPSLKLLN